MQAALFRLVKSRYLLSLNFHNYSRNINSLLVGKFLSNLNNTASRFPKFGVFLKLNNCKECFKDHEIIHQTHLINPFSTLNQWVENQLYKETTMKENFWHASNYCPTNKFMVKVNNRNTRKKCEICSKSTVKTPERRQRRRSGVFIVNFEHILDLFHGFLLLTLKK